MEAINEWQHIEQSSSADQFSSSSTSTHHEDDEISSPVMASSSGSVEEDEASKALDCGNEGKSKVLKEWFEAMRVEIVKVASKVNNSCGMCEGAFWSITCVAGAAAAATAVLVYVGIRRRRRKVDGLDYVVRQKDEKIRQLLHDIAHLNEALSSRRNVPVYQIGG